MIQRTHSQVRFLRYYLEHRNQPPTMGNSLRKFSLVLALWIASTAAGCWYAFHLGKPELAYLLVGLIVGAVLREVRQLIWTIQIWPAAVAITDWRRVAELLSGSTSRAESTAVTDQPGDRQ